nr:FtsX-like permease family protein [Lachnospiraceae bacterium]
AIIILIFLASIMLNLWLMLSMDYKQNFDRYHDKLNAEHVTLAVASDDTEMREFLMYTLKNDMRTTEFSIDNSMYISGMFEYNGGEINPYFIILEKQTAVSRMVGKVEIIEDSKFTSGIYMPILYKSEDIAVGKTITISIGGNKITYTICGFFNSIMAGSHNCNMCELILTEDKYNELQEMGYAPKSTLCSIRLNDKTDSEDYETLLNNIMSSQYPTVDTVSNSYAFVSQSRYVSQMICSSIMSAMAFFILLIVLASIISNISNYIIENMKNLGTLKAIGYTSSQLICSLLLQFLGLTLIIAIIGVGGSYCLFPFVNNMMISQTGIPYTMHFLPFPMFISLIILGGSVMLAVLLPARRIKKIEPITALRQGILTHNFKHNYVPLEKTHAPINLALALKTALLGMKYNITICITMLVLSLVVVFSGLMTENIITDITPFLNLVVGETTDSCINVNGETEKEFLCEMMADERVEKIYLYTSCGVSHVGGVELLATICDDFSNLNNPSLVYKGRFPKFDNEIAIAGKYAKKNNLKIGDEITLTTKGNEAKYIISGFTQTSNYLGKDCLLTRSGYERIGELQTTSYYLNLVDGSDTDSFNSEVKVRFGNEINSMVNVESVIDGVAPVYVTLLTIIVIAILVLSFTIIVFVLYLLVRTMLNSKKRDYGILKALGFTTRQLILQTAVSFMPAVILSTIVGLIVSSYIINPLTAIFLSGIGIVKCTFAVPVGFISVAGIGLILFTFVISCLLSLKIKKIAPKSLIIGE